MTAQQITDHLPPPQETMNVIRGMFGDPERGDECIKAARLVATKIVDPRELLSFAETMKHEALMGSASGAATLISAALVLAIQVYAAELQGQEQRR